MSALEPTTIIPTSENPLSFGEARAAVYLRVSSPGQVRTDYDPEGLSLPAQRTACERKASAIGAKVVRRYVEPGVSGGALVKRVAFRQMIEDIRELCDIDYVIVWSVSRWARNQEDRWTARGLVERTDDQLIAVKEEYFICAGNQVHKCPQRAQRVDAVEAAVENYYRTVAITPDESRRVKIAVEERLDAFSETSIREIERCKELLANLKMQ